MASEQTTFAFAGDTAGADAPEPQQQPDSSRPEWLDEKFESPEALQQAYNELQKKMGSGSAEETPSESEETSAETNADDQGENVKNIIGSDAFEKYSGEYAENGSLTEESYNELSEKFNFSKELVDLFIEGQAAKADAQALDVFNSVGGEENYRSIMEWAGEHLNDEDMNAYNNVIKEGSTQSIKLALMGLQAKYSQNNPTLVSGTGKATVGGYSSKAEMIADMRKPEYKEDPAFRERVERKLANTREGVI